MNSGEHSSVSLPSSKLSFVLLAVAVHSSLVAARPLQWLQLKCQDERKGEVVETNIPGFGITVLVPGVGSSPSESNLNTFSLSSFKTRMSTHVASDFRAALRLTVPTLEISSSTVHVSVSVHNKRNKDSGQMCRTLFRKKFNKCSLQRWNVCIDSAIVEFEFKLHSPKMRQPTQSFIRLECSKFFGVLLLRADVGGKLVCKAPGEDSLLKLTWHDDAAGFQGRPEMS